MVLRFGNAILEPLWRAPYIRRADHRRRDGRRRHPRRLLRPDRRMRDMVQNHLLQLLHRRDGGADLARPRRRSQRSSKVLRSLRKMTLADIQRDTVRGQYTAGVVDGQQVKGYLTGRRAEGSETETFVAIRAQVNNARWAGVPFFLRTGKRIAKRHSEIIIESRSHRSRSSPTSRRHRLTA